MFPTPGFCDEIMRFYCVGPADPARRFRAERDEDEDIRVRTFPLVEAREMIRDGGIVDLKTAYALSF
jgi:hypothetical protein